MASSDTADLNALALKRNWGEDTAHENGNYNCHCVFCGQPFLGHKRRVSCRLCEKEPIQSVMFLRDEVKRLATAATPPSAPTGDRLQGPGPDSTPPTATPSAVPEEVRQLQQDWQTLKDDYAALLKYCGVESISELRDEYLRLKSFTTPRAEAGTTEEVRPEFPPVKEIEMVEGDFGEIRAPSMWRVEVGGYCGDFESEIGAHNFHDAIIALLRTSDGWNRDMSKAPETPAVRAQCEAEYQAEIDSAVLHLKESRRTSGCVSFIQRKLGIGYNRASRIMEIMERRKIITPANNRGERFLIAPPTEAGHE